MLEQQQEGAQQPDAPTPTQPGGDLIADAAAAKDAPTPNPADQLQEQAAKAVEANAEPALQISPDGKTEIVRIGTDGNIFWRGRLVESDIEFKLAMLDMAEHIRAPLVTMPVQSVAPSPDLGDELVTVDGAAETALEAETAQLDLGALVDLMRTSLTHLENCIAIGRHDEARAERSRLAYFSFKIARHIP